MNVFGAITVLVAVFGAFVGAFLCALVLYGHTVSATWWVISTVGVVSGYLSVRVYFWLLRRLDERARRN